MDGFKLAKWRRIFEDEVKGLQIEYDVFSLPKKFQDIYQLKVSDTSQMLSLCIDINNAPLEIQNCLSELLLKTEPEDSI